MKLDKADILLSFVSGALTGLSAPGFNQWYLAWVGFIPLIYVIAKQKAPISVVLYSFSFGLTYHLVYLSWFMGLHPLYWLGFNYIESISIVFIAYYLLACLQSIFITIFGLITFYALKLPTGKAFFIALAWIFCVNILSNQGIFAFPWALVEYSQYKNIGLLQLTSLIGGIGIAFLIVLFNSYATLTIIYIEKSVKIMVDESESYQSKLKLSLSILKTKKFLKKALPMFFIAFILILVSNIRLLGQQNSSKDIIACAVQADIPIEAYKTNRINTFTEHRIYSNLISQCPNNSLIVLPEGAYSSYLRANPSSEILEDLQEMSSSKHSSIIVGANDMNTLGYTNALISINPYEKHLTSNNVYGKNHLVPFGEYVPFRKGLPKFLEEMASVSSKDDYSPGLFLNPIPTIFGDVGPGICFEAIFPELSKTIVRNGAVILVNSSNLGWYHFSMIDTQFLAIAAFRAAETHRPMIVAINNGSSAIIDNNGAILKKSEKNKTTLINAKIKPSSTFTFFTL